MASGLLASCLCHRENVGVLPRGREGFSYGILWETSGNPTRQKDEHELGQEPTK